MVDHVAGPGLHAAGSTPRREGATPGRHVEHPPHVGAAEQPLGYRVVDPRRGVLVFVAQADRSRTAASCRRPAPQSNDAVADERRRTIAGRLPRAVRPHAALSLALLLAPLPAQTRLPGPPPVHVEVTADATALQTAGTATLRIRFVCDEPLERAYAVRIELRRGGRELLRRDHAPPVPSRKWAKGKGVEYDLPCAFRLPPATLKAGDRIEVWLGLLDEAALDDQNRVVAVASPKAGPDRMARVAEFVFAALGATPDAAAIDALIAAALPLAAKQPGAAWDQLEFAFRRLDDYPLKAKLQKALLQVGRMPAPTPTFEEQAIVQARIRDERARYLRIVAGRMNDRGRLLGALLLLDEVGGALQEDADRAVLGALDAAQRATKDREGLAAKIFAPTKE